MAREAVEVAKQRDRARLGLGVGPVAWMDRKYDDRGFIRKEPAANRVQPAKGAVKVGRHSRALFMGHWSDSYPSGTSAVVATAAMAHVGEAAGATLGDVSEATLSWGLALTEFLSGVTWSTGFQMALVAFIGGVWVGYIVLLKYFMARPTSGSTNYTSVDPKYEIKESM